MQFSLTDVPTKHRDPLDPRSDVDPWLDLAQLFRPVGDCYCLVQVHRSLRRVIKPGPSHVIGTGTVKSNLDRCRFESCYALLCLQATLLSLIRFGSLLHATLSPP